MIAAFANSSSHARAITGSVMVHALVAAWALSTVITPADIMPQQMIEVSLVAAPNLVEKHKPSKPKPTPTRPLKPVENIQQKVPPKPQLLSKASPRALPKQTTHTPPAEASPETKSLASPETAKPSGHTSSTQQIITQPLFDAAYLNNPAPDYPAQAKRRQMQGTVMLDVAVSITGAAQTVRIAQSSGFALLDESARRTVSRWKFIPAKRGDQTVQARVMVPIEFRLQ